MTNFWTTYHRWNEAILSRYFARRFAQTPVYLDLDDGMLDEIGKNAGFRLDDGLMHEQFLEAVRPTLQLSSDFLANHVRRRRIWEREIREGKPENQDKIPPFIALLGFFNYTAYMMRRGGGFIAGNYHDRLVEAVYGRVVEPARKNRLGNNFRNHIVDFYDSLARWLDFQNLGSLGLSTANPGPFEGRKYIGYPISQSIMGRDDRAKLPACFRFGRLSPGDDISLDEMIDLLSRWIPFSNLNQVAISTFNKGDDDKTAVAEIAQAELRAWRDSDDGGGEERVSARNLIIVMENKTFPRRQVRLTLGFVDHDGPRAERRFAINWSSQPIFDISGEKLDELTFEESGPGLWLNRDQVNISDFLITEVHLENQEERRQLTWPLSKVVVFEQNDDLLQLVSTIRPTQGKRLSILAHEQEETQVVEKIKEAQVEGASYEKLESITGIPRGFILFDGVRLKSTAFDAVRPAPRIHLERGVKIPGQRFWLSSRLPNVAFVSPQPAEECRLDLVELANVDNPVPKRLLVSVGVGDAKSADLSDGTIPIGPYKLTLALGSGSGIFNRSMNFGVCSADIASPDTRELLTDEGLIEDPLHPAHLDEAYTGEELEEILAPSPDDLPPVKFDAGSAEEEVDPEASDAVNWGTPLPIPEMHLRLETGYRVRHDELGDGEVIEIDENRVGITVDFEGAEAPIRVTGGIVKILPPEIHLKLNVGDEVRHDGHGDGTVVELDADRVSVTIAFGPSGVTNRVTHGIIKILTPALHFTLKVGDRVQHRQFGAGEVIGISPDASEVQIRFDSGSSDDRHPETGMAVTNGIDRVLPPRIHFDLRIGDRVEHDEHGEGTVTDLDEDRTGITIVFAGGPITVTSGIQKLLAPEIHLQLRIDDRIEHVRHGFGRVRTIGPDRAIVKVNFDKDGRKVRSIAREIIKILEIDRSELKPRDRVRHTRYGIGTVQKVEEDNETVLVNFGTGAKINDLKQIVNGIYEKMESILVGNHLGEKVRHREYGTGEVKGFAGPLVDVDWGGKIGYIKVPQEDLEAL